MVEKIQQRNKLLFGVLSKIELYVKVYYIGKPEPIVAHTPWCTVQCSKIHKVKYSKLK